MSRRAAHFLEADVRRALSAAQKTGPTWTVTIEPNGAIRLVQAPDQGRPAPERDNGQASSLVRGLATPP